MGPPHSPTGPDPQAPRLLAAARAAYGAVLLTTPRPLVTVLSGARPGTREARLARCLGARHLVQSALTASDVNGPTLVLSAGVDLVHVASSVAVMAVSPRHRSVAFAETVLAAGLAVSSLVVARRARPTHNVGRLPTTPRERFEETRNALARRILHAATPRRRFVRGPRRRARVETSAATAR